MFDFIKSLFAPAPPSSSTAKERLRLVLLSDHLSLAPDVVDALKKDLLAVISRYVTIDSAHADVSFEHRDKEVAMLASIPITGVRARTAEERATLAAVKPAPLPPAPPSRAADPVETAAAVEPTAASLEGGHGEVDTVPDGELPLQAAPVVGSATAATAATAATVKSAPRRRRRKKSPNTVASAAERAKLSGPQPGYSAQG